jgi:hypothetical protein
MRNDRLQALLARADVAELPEMSRDLAQRVRMAAKKRARLRLIGAGLGTAASLGVCVAIVAVILHSKDLKTMPTPLTQARVTEIRAELARLDSEVSLHQKTAEILVRRQARAVRGRAAEPLARQRDVTQRVDDARERAALMLVREARRTFAEGGRDAAADEDYERAARLFPETAAGREAARHVKRT